MREIRLLGVTDPKVRCKACAGEPVPPLDELPAVPATRPPLALPTWAGVSEMAHAWQPRLPKVSQGVQPPAFDGKAAGANEREPGEEG